jgi:hypothetical protein
MIREGSCLISSEAFSPLQSANSLAPVIKPEPIEAVFRGHKAQGQGHPALASWALRCPLAMHSRGCVPGFHRVLPGPLPGTSCSEVPGVIILTRSPDNTTVPLRSTPHCPFSLRLNESESKYLYRQSVWDNSRLKDWAAREKDRESQVHDPEFSGCLPPPTSARA